MKNNPFLARFASEPVLVSEHHGDRFAACLSSAVAHPAYAQIVEHAAQANDDEFWPAPDDWLASYRPYSVRDGILQIPVQGVLVNNFGYAVGGMITGYNYIRKAFERGMSDPDVRGIALAIDSPGGEVAGNFDLVDVMFEKRGSKPVRAFAAENAYSAAYSIASVADQIVVSRTGGVGSIGVVTMHADMSEALAKDGVKITFIHFGKHKVEGNSYEPLSADAKARIQMRIDALGELFVATVARNRGLSEKAVRDTEALTYMAADAVSIGLADSIGQFDDAVAAFAAQLSRPEEFSMSGQKEVAAVDQAAVEAARVEAHAAGKADGVREGAASERARISAILALDESKTRRESALTLALSAEVSVDTAKAILANLPEQKAPAAEAPVAAGNKALFDAAMQASGNPNVGSEAAGAEEQDLDSAEAVLATARMAGITGLRSKH
jgi:capsid assembly protease